MQNFKSLHLHETPHVSPLRMSRGVSIVKKILGENSPCDNGIALYLDPHRYGVTTREASLFG